LRQIAPQQKFGFAIAVLLIALIAHPVSQLLIIGWLSIWTIVYARIPFKVYLQLFAVAGIFLFMSIPALVLNGISLNEIAAIRADEIQGIAVGNWYLFISRSGLIQASQIAARSLACTSCLLFILFTIPFTDLLHLLRQLRIPTLLTELLLLMYRFIFLFFDVVTELQLAQQARGGYRTRKRWMYSVGLLISQLLVRSLHHYHDFSLALNARGFNGTFQVYSNQKHYYSRRYAIESILGCLGLLILQFKV
jgi:cobalt/nickel transport system permease protein